jgi:sterol desaturase/sphingolipid hydroxylase (fatty acid hydroxylase superfamily)
MSVYVILLVLVSLSGATMAVLSLGYGRPVAEGLRIREERTRRLGGRPYAVRAIGNALLSAALVFGLMYALHDRVLYYEAPVWWRYPVEALAILVVYDFLYYLLHRYPFHQWSVLKRVHAVHHQAKYPRAVDSLFLHPVENILGLILLMGCVWLVGPVHVYSFAAAFFVHSQVNVVVHGGLDLPGPLRFLGALARKHDRHHQSMRAGNYASITPLPDLLFGTAE